MSASPDRIWQGGTLRNTFKISESTLHSMIMVQRRNITRLHRKQCGGGFVLPHSSAFRQTPLVQLRPGTSTTFDPFILLSSPYAKPSPFLGRAVLRPRRPDRKGAILHSRRQIPRHPARLPNRLRGLYVRTRSIGRCDGAAGASHRSWSFGSMIKGHRLWNSSRDSYSRLFAFYSPDADGGSVVSIFAADIAGAVIRSALRPECMWWCGGCQRSKRGQCDRDIAIAQADH